MKKWTWLSLFAAALFFNTTTAHAFNKGEYIFRLGAAYVEPNDDSGNVTGVAGSAVGVDGAGTLGFTIGRMITDNVSFEMFGIYPSNHDLVGEGTLSTAGLTDIGEVDVFPPTFSFNYYVYPTPQVAAHIGVGVSGVFYFNPELSGTAKNALGNNSDLDIDNTVGFGGNIGVDFKMTDKLLLSLAVIYSDFDADATIKNTNAGNLSVDVEVDPVVGFVALGTTF